MTRKTTLVFMGLLLILLLTGSYLFSGIFQNPEGIRWEQLEGQFLEILRHPFRNYWNARTPACMGVGILVWIAFAGYYAQQLGNFMFGKEYGTASFADAKVLKKKYCDPRPEENRILSKDLQVSYDTWKTGMTNNMLVIGGTGRGKGFHVIFPNLLNAHGSYVVTDTKGDSLRTLGNYLKQQGYRIRVLNLIDFAKSQHYDPFCYIRSEIDVSKLVTNIMDNTTPADVPSSSDPFWPKAERLYLQSLFLYVWLECPPGEKNFRSVMDLMAKAKIVDQEDSELDLIMKSLEARSVQGAEHPAVRCYKKFRAGAGETMRSIIILANSRFADFDKEEVLQLLDQDELHFEDLGIGVCADQKTKSALFILIPDDDPTFNFIAGMAYTQIIQTLYQQARVFPRGRLPIDVGLWLDEAANIKMPDHFDGIVTTVRSRGIYIVMFLQALTQLKGMYKEKWETISGNLETQLYLGSSEESSLKYFSEALGKRTIDKRSHGQSYGRNGSASSNTDVLGRELLTPDELRRMDKRRCLVLLPGEYPVLDWKYPTLEDPRFQQAVSLGAYPLADHRSVQKRLLVPLEEAGLEYYQKAGAKILTIRLEDFLQLDLSGPGELDTEQLQELAARLASEETSREETVVDLREGDPFDWLMRYPLAEDQVEQILCGIEEGLTDEEIRLYYHPQYSVKKMKQMRTILAAQKKRKKGKKE